MIIDSKAEDIVYSRYFGGTRGLRPSLEAMGLTERMVPGQKVDLSDADATFDAEAQAWKTLWSAGQE